MSVTDKQYTFLATADLLSPVKTFECGQCFRWNAGEDGVYTGVASGRVLRVRRENGDVLCSAEKGDLAFWENYFDLDSDYSGANARFRQVDYLRDCAEYGTGIRILRQEPWEALCSFIISQCNNIPRIKGIVESLCHLYGDELEKDIFSFPGPERLAPLTEDDLAPLRSGYRAEYILNAARAVDSGELDFQQLRSMEPEEALERVRGIRGIGSKVANCFLLYGMHIMDRFPIDVWMKRALKEHFPPDFDPAALGDFSGLAQQYIFYYARETAAAHKTAQRR